MDAVRRTIALTGGIASGKTAVSDRFAELGAIIVDADVLAREAVEPGTPGLAAIRERFGDADQQARIASGAAAEVIAGMAAKSREFQDAGGRLYLETPQVQQP